MQVESLLQCIFQGFVFIALFNDERNPTYIFYVSMLSSFFMVVLTLSKTLMPKKFSQKQSLTEKVKNIVWVVCISNMSVLVVIINLILFAAFFIQDVHLLSPAQQRSLTLSSTFWGTARPRDTRP